LIERLSSELKRARERTEAQARRAEAVERRLAELTERLGVPTLAIEAFDPLPQAASRATMPEAASAMAPPLFASPETAEGAPIADWWPRGSEPGRPLLPDPGWRHSTLQGERVKVIGVSVCGLRGEDLRRTISLVAEQQNAARDFIPVFLTDSSEFELFRAHGFVFEYFPGAAGRARIAGSQSWAGYAAQRRSLVERKWGLDRVISFGPEEFGRIEETREIGQISADDPTPSAGASAAASKSSE
jgi:hypothetical protein